MRNVYAMIENLLDMEIVGEDNTVVFSEEAKQLIHEISEECVKIPAVAENKDKAEEYGKGLSAEDVYLDMLIKIAKAPTTLHMMLVPVGLVPIISKKLRER